MAFLFMFNFLQLTDKKIPQTKASESSQDDPLEFIRGEYPFTSKFTTIGVQQFHFIDEGRGEILLFIHGNPTWSFLFRRLITALHLDYRCIAPDHIGFGLSAKPQKYDYSLESHIDNLEAFILKYDLNKITLIAHGYGSAIAMGCAIRQPKRFSRFIMMNAFSRSSPKLTPLYRLMRTPFLGKFIVCEYNLLVKLMLAYGTVTPLTHIAHHGFSFPYNSFENRIGPYRLLEDIPISQDQYSFETFLQVEHGLWLFKEKPFLLVCGLKDNRFKPRESLELWKITYPQAEVLELEEAGHLLLEDAPVEVIRFIKKFLEDNPIDED